MRINGYPEENEPTPPECECTLIHCWHDSTGCNNIASYTLTFTRKGESKYIFVCESCFKEYEKAQCPDSGITMFARHIGDWRAKKCEK